MKLQPRISDVIRDTIFEQHCKNLTSCNTARGLIVNAVVIAALLHSKSFNVISSFKKALPKCRCKFLQVLNNVQLAFRLATNMHRLALACMDLH